MEKTDKKHSQNKNKKNDKIWINKHTSYKKRTCGSGLTFTGKYEIERSD